ncbi:hypothetical protein MBLNU230_g6428t1 [Neophaeotheca triangularis]
MGRQYDDPKSRGHIVPFIRAFKLEQTLQELEQPDISQYRNFNAFFSRALKANARPIAEPTNDLVFTSPADCRMTAFSTTDLATKYWIKGHGFTIGKLLGGDHWASSFGGGSMTIARLAPQDYHRWHAPTSGKVAARFEIPGTYYTVNPQAINEAGTLNVFCENRRSAMCLQRPNGTYVAVVAVGAMLVGSIIYEAGVKVGAMVQRGQCLGRFQYGGSTVIVLWPPGEVALDEDLVASSGAGEPCETLMRVGWRVGVAPTKGRVGGL